MPPTISANDLTLCHQGSNAVATASLPDVCLTPMPFGPVPIPYPNIARSGTLSGGSQRVSADGSSIALQGSKFASSVGDEAGSAGGVSSGMNQGTASFISTSPNVRVEGKPVGRLTDKMLMNGGNTVCMGGLIISPVSVSVPDLETAITSAITIADQAWLEIQFLDPKGNPVPDEPYQVLDLAGKVVNSGRLDGKGWAKVADLHLAFPYRVTFPENLWLKKQLEQSSRPESTTGHNVKEGAIAYQLGSVASVRLRKLNTFQMDFCYCLIDSHTHIFNLDCTPPVLTREMIPFAALALAKRLSFPLTRLWNSRPVNELSRDLLIESEEALSELLIPVALPFSPKDPRIGNGIKSGLLAPMTVVLMMDMDFAHLGGYQGDPIYFPGTAGTSTGKSWYYTHREFEVDLKSDEPRAFIRVTTKKENQLALKGKSLWEDQVKATTCEIQSNPWRLLPFYGFEPRRCLVEGSSCRDWILSNAPPASPDPMSAPCLGKSLPAGCPLKLVATKNQPGIFLGFKLYTGLGWQPLDPRLPHLLAFYRWCAREGVPLVEHCSPGPMYTHDWPFYWDHEHPGSYENYCRPILAKYKEERRKLAGNPDAIIFLQQTYQKKLLDEYKESVRQIFVSKFVGPDAWEEALEKVHDNDLRLCLAHCGGSENMDNGLQFGGDWPRTIASLAKSNSSLYTDFSCFDVEKNGPNIVNFLSTNQHLDNRILFGTDWYLITLPTFTGFFSGDLAYRLYCTNFKRLLDSPSLAGRNLWRRMTFLNPFRFFGLHDQERMKNFANGLKSGPNGADAKAVDDGLERVKRLSELATKLELEHDHGSCLGDDAYASFTGG